MHAPSIWALLIVAAVVVLLFGRGKISGMMGEVAQGIKAFQKGMRDEETPRVETVVSPVTPAPQPMQQTVVEPRKDA